MTKRLFSLVLTVVLLLSCVSGALAEEVKLNTYKYWEPNWPLANGDVEVTIAASVNSSYYVDPAKNWFWTWAQQATGLKINVIQITDEAVSERRTLMFASDDLPDVLMGMGLTTGDLMRYGLQEGQLLDITPYITSETMPYLTMWCEKYPMIRTIATTPDGKIYCLPYTNMNSDYIGSQETLFYNMEWLQEVHPEVGELPTTREAYEQWMADTADVLPHTLDEFTELMYAFKANHPDSTPIAGLDSTNNPLGYLMHAFGFLGGNGYGYEVSLREGKVVMPATDPVFFEYLKLVNQYYNDGIISKDFFTADAMVNQSLVTSNNAAVFAGAPYGYLPESKDYHKWDALFPLTSEYNPTTQVKESNRFAVGTIVLSSRTEHAELLLNFLDFFYSDLGIYYPWCGPLNGSEDTLGMVEGFYYDLEKGAKVFPDVINGTYENSIAYVEGMGLGMANICNRSHSITEPDKYTTMMETLQHVQGVADEDINRVKLAYEHGDNYARMGSEQRVLPYVVNGFPDIVYYDADTQETIDEITLLLNDYVESEVAKFITGVTPLTEANFQSFVDTCNTYGAQDLVDIWTEAYNNYLAAQ